MTKNFLPSLRALSGLTVPVQPSCPRGARTARTSKGWIGEALEMLRADVTNVDYLVYGFCRR
jgi:hypothetical protein